MKTFLYLAITFLVFSCTQKQNDGYCNGNLYCPNDSDTNCIKEVEKAKADIENNDIYFCAYAYPFHMKRYHEFIGEAAQKYGAKGRLAIVSDVIRENEEQNCYCKYMDAWLEKKYGINLRDRVEKEADTLFAIAAQIDTIESFDCDEDYRAREQKIYGYLYSRFSYSNIQTDRTDGSFPGLDAWYVLDSTGKAHLQQHEWKDSLGLDRKEMNDLYRQLVSLSESMPVTARCTVLGRKAFARLHLSIVFDPEKAGHYPAD